MKRILFGIVLLLASVTCGSGGDVGLSVILQADSILIKEEWMGLSPLAPYKSEYALKKKAQTYAGDVSFSVGYGARERKGSAKTEVPAPVMQEFLKMLSGVPLKEGVYKPKIEHTDDYPYIAIELKIKDEVVLFWTRSQGPGNIPWALDFRKKQYIIDSEIPEKALKTLDPYMQREAQKKFVAEVEGKKN